LRYTMAARFEITDSLRFLSHQETLRLFQRALVRSGIRLSYSEGFNPRPRVSLPLPRSVGLEGDAELLCALIETACPAKNETEESRFIEINAQQIRAKLERQLPQDCRLMSLDLMKGRVGFYPAAAIYEFEVSGAEPVENIKSNAEKFLAGEHFFMERRINEKGDTRVVDVRGFVESIKF
jgi:radical SAM-linked protein